MSLYLPTPGLADAAKFRASMTALDLTCLRALGAGVLAGLTVDGAGVLSAGEALIGHVVALDAPVSLAAAAKDSSQVGALAPSSVNYVYLQMPPMPSCVGADGRDAGLVVVNQTGAAPVNAVLLATVTTGPAPSPSTSPLITDVGNSPAGRRNLAAPLGGETLLTLAPHALTLTPGANYQVGVDVSAAGTFGDALYRVGCACTDLSLVISESLGPKTPGKMFFTLHYMLAPGGSTVPVTVSVTASAKGAGYTGQATTGNQSSIAGAWDALTPF